MSESQRGLPEGSRQLVAPPRSYRSPQRAPPHPPVSLRSPSLIHSPPIPTTSQPWLWFCSCCRCCCQGPRGTPGVSHLPLGKLGWKRRKTEGGASDGEGRVDVCGMIQAGGSAEERGEGAEGGDGSGVRLALWTCPNPCLLQPQLHWTAALETG